MMRTLLGYGSTGSDVKSLQIFLRGLGHYRSETDGHYGPMTEKAVRSYQTGQSLIVDGIVGPITWAIMFPDQDVPVVAGETNLASAVLSVCETLLHIRETNGKNRSADIDRMTKDLGIPLGSAWCMIAVQWIYKEAGKRAGLKFDPLRPDTGGVMDLFYRAPDDWKHDVLNGKPGDIMILDYGRGLGHTGILIKYQGGIYHSFEGNAGADDGRDGDGFYRKESRKYSDPRLRGFVRPVIKE